MKADRSNSNIRRAKRTDRLMTAVFYGCDGFFLVLLISLAAYIIVRGIAGFYPGILAFDINGIGNQLFNTVYLVFLSLAISVPIGIAAGIYMAEYAKPGRFLKFLRISIESLSSLPSIVVGLFGYLVFILMTGMKWNLFAGALSVSILSLPSITSTVEDALRALPKGYREGSMGLGATKRQTILNVLLPACMSRIMTGILLAAGRGFFHISPYGDAEPCPFSPYSDMNVKDTSLQEAMDSKLFRKLQDQSILMEEHAGGCVLFEKKEQVEALL
ncbi:MAG: ABC transporter permease subunit [Erysipelotrichia bacterium]|nr:ABC transporter permease subunit [Erysipelotrichia bacterium]